MAVAQNTTADTNLKLLPAIEAMYAHWGDLSAQLNDAPGVPHDDTRFAQLAETQAQILAAPSDTVRAVMIKIAVSHADESDCLDEGQVTLMREARRFLAAH